MSNQHQPGPELLHSNKDRFVKWFPKINQWDTENVQIIYHRFSHSTWRLWARFISFLGDPRLWAPLCIILGIFGLFNDFDFSYVIIFFMGFFQTFLTYQIIKKIVKRPRPFHQLDNIERLDKTGHGYSFPSGHTHHSTIMMGLIFLVFLPYPWFIPIMLTYNISMALSRLISGCHFPIDVIFAIPEAYLELFFYWFVTKSFFVNEFLILQKLIFGI
ncbi:MAG: phosphatase PAP2 family protein [Promethearchaeota archaeon]